MKGQIIPLAMALLAAVAPASAEIVIRTKDGKTYKVPVEAAEIASIELQPSGAPLAATAPPILLAPPAPAPHTVPTSRWVDDSRSSHFFVKEGAQWIEYLTGMIYTYYTPKQTTPEFVELYDPSRHESVRLFADHAEWSKDQKKWTVTDRGSWRK